MAGRNDIQASAGIDLSQFEAGLQTLIQRVESLEGTANKVDSSVKKVGQSSEQAAVSLKVFKDVLGAFGLSLSVAGIVAYGKEILNIGKSLSDSAAESDLSAENFQKVRGALQNFVGVNDATQAIQRVAQAMRDAKNNSNPQAIAQFQALGVSFESLASPGANAATILGQIADGYTNAEDKADYAARLSRFFGDDLTRRLIPALQGGSKELKNLGESANVAGDQMTEGAKKGELALERLGIAAKNLSLNIVGFLAGVAALPGYVISVAKTNAAQMNQFHKDQQYVADHPNERHPIDPFSEQNQSTAINPDLTTPKGIAAAMKAGVISHQQAIAYLQDYYAKKRTAQAPTRLQDSAQAGGTARDNPNFAPIAGGGDNLLKINTDLNEALAKRTPTLKSQLDILKAQSDAVERELALPVTKANAERTSELHAQDAEIKLATSDLKFQAEQQQILADLSNQALTQEIAGQDYLSKITEIQAKWEEKIATARREGRDDLAATYVAAQNLELLQADASLYAQNNATQNAAIVTSINNQIAAQRALNALNAQNASDANTDANGQPIDPSKPFGRNESIGFRPTVHGSTPSPLNQNDNVFGWGDPGLFGDITLGKAVKGPKTPTHGQPPAKAAAVPIIQAQSVTTQSIVTGGIKPAS